MKQVEHKVHWRERVIWAFRSDRKILTEIFDKVASETLSIRRWCELIVNEGWPRRARRLHAPGGGGGPNT